MLLNNRSHRADDTPALVVDFDHGEIKDKNDNDDESNGEDKNSKKRQRVVCPDICLCWAWLTTHQGTPIFMARSVVAGHPLTAGLGVGEFFIGLPPLSQLALPVYSELLGDRLSKFPQPPDNQEYHVIMIPKEFHGNPKSLRALPWTHELHHDGNLCFGCSCGGPSTFAPNLRHLQRLTRPQR